MNFNLRQNYYENRFYNLNFPPQSTLTNWRLSIKLLVQWQYKVPLIIGKANQTNSAQVHTGYGNNVAHT